MVVSGGTASVSISSRTSHAVGVWPARMHTAGPGGRPRVSLSAPMPEANAMQRAGRGLPLPFWSFCGGLLRNQLGAKWSAASSGSQAGCCCCLGCCPRCPEHRRVGLTARCKGAGNEIWRSRLRAEASLLPTLSLLWLPSFRADLPSAWLKHGVQQSHQYFSRTAVKKESPLCTGSRK